jgi:outer membrane biosynthesis protein TonB
MWLSEIINQTLCDKFYTKKYIYEDDEVNQPDNTENPSESPAQQPPAQQPPAQQPPAQQPPAQQPPVQQPPVQQPPAPNQTSAQQVLNKMQPDHVAMATQHFGQAASQFVQQNPLAAGAIGATAAIGTGLMAKKAIQNSRQ